MFLYKVEVKTANNPRMGLGLFAKEFIPKNSIVWKFIEGIDIKISIDDFNKLNDAQKEYFYKYGWIEKNEDNFYYSSGDLTNFMNHSYTPNITSKNEFSVSVKDIDIDEELFIDYSNFCLDFDASKVTE
jgi:SET domain-containing protein